MPEISANPHQENLQNPPVTPEHTKNPEQFRQRVESLIENTHGKIVLTSHTMPDDDAVCSTVAYKRILEQQYPGKEFSVVFSDRSIDAWRNFIPVSSEITWAGDTKGKNPDGFVRKGDVVDYIKENDMVICLDGGTFSRFSRFQGELEGNTTIKTVILDHHQGTPSNADVMYIEPESTSTAELLAKLYDVDSMPPETCELLLAGILSDTQHFMIAGDHTETKKIAEKLQEKCGKSFAEIAQMITHSDQEKVYQETFRKHIHTYQKENSPKQQYSFMTFKERIAKVPTTNSDYDFFIARRAFQREMSDSGKADIYWTASPVRLESNGSAAKYSVSFRRDAASEIDLHALAETYGGGGHTAAAAGTYELSEEQIATIKEKKKADKFFSETAYVCELIAEEIAVKLAIPETADSAGDEEQTDEPIQKIKEELQEYTAPVDQPEIPSPSLIPRSEPQRTRTYRVLSRIFSLFGRS